MSVDVFQPSNDCPLCRNLGGHSRLQGKFRCPCCESQLVVSPQGQFVRDPFRAAPRLSIRQLRRQSRPLARLRRDLQPLLWACVGLVTLGTIGGLTYEITRARFVPSSPPPSPVEPMRAPDRP